MLSVVLPTPLKVNATDDYDVESRKQLISLGIIASYAGIDIDIDEIIDQFPNFVDDVMDLAVDIYDELAEEYGWTNTQSGGGGGGLHREPTVIEVADDLECYLDYLSSQLQPFNPSGIGVNYKFILCVVRAIALWYSEHFSNSSPASGDLSISYGSVSNSSGFIDVYSSGSFGFTFPDLSPQSFSTVYFNFNSCYFAYYINPSQNFMRYLLGYSRINDSSFDSPTFNKLYYCLYPNDLDIYLLGCNDSYSVSSLFGRTFSNDIFNGATWDSSFLREKFYLSASSSDGVLLPLFNSDYGFFSHSKQYYITTYQDGYAFVYHKDYSDQSIYNGLTFPTSLDALYWFFDNCGIDLRSGHSSSYVASDSSNVISIDNERYNQVINNTTYQSGDTVSMAFPSYYTVNNYYNYDDYRHHPEYILDFSQAGLYNSDLDLPTYDGNKLANKFPFCIPFDIIHLFSGFLSDPEEAPELHFVVLPANSFGLQNDEFCIDVDFQDYNIIVQLLRFFVAVAFLLWLMLITNNLLQH